MVEPDTGDSQGQYKVKFRATVGEVLLTLETAGLGWNAAVAAYSAVRVERGAGTASVISESLTAEMDAADTEKRVEEFTRVPPEADLRYLQELLKHQVGGQSESILDALNYEDEVPHPFHLSFSSYREMRKLGLKGAAEVSRAVESLLYLRIDAPLLAWPLIICVYLGCLDPDAIVELDLSDDAADQVMAENENDAKEYAANYWTESASALAGTAQSLGRLFGVLSAFDGSLSREFWFARAAELLGQIRAMNEAGSETTKKKGDALEGLMESLLRTEDPELRVIEKNFRTAEEEIDVLVSNGLKDPFWSSQGSPLILIECKNWRSRVGVPELRVFESKMRDRGALCRIGIFVSLAGFSRPFLDRLKSFQETGGIIFALDGGDVTQLVSEKMRVSEWLRVNGMRRALGS
ncbi:restriction endonuclease [Streptomyces sp. NPDC059556]|uniref:restriction endonuclease n=1 Tax=Streptomyces sp. NPDC059556 TaxID=3346863 RepID=UPI0036CFB878